MQRSACAAHLVGERAGAPVVEQYDVHLLRAVAGRDAVPHRRVGVHPLAGRRARQQAQEDVEVGEGGHDLLDADHRHQHLGQGQAHPAVALGLDDDQRAGLGDGEVRARDPDLGAQELLAQVEPRGVRELGRVVGEAVGSRAAGRRHPGPEDLAHLGPVAVDGRHQDVGGQVVGELHDQLGQVGLPGRDALGGEGLVEPDLLGHHRLDLHDLVDAVRLRDVGDDAAGLGGVPRPVHHGAAARPALPRAARGGGRGRPGSRP